MTISDIDECIKENGGCQMTCTNLIGSYACICPHQLKLSLNGKTCEGKHRKTYIQYKRPPSIRMKPYK